MAINNCHSAQIMQPLHSSRPIDCISYLPRYDATNHMSFPSLTKCYLRPTSALNAAHVELMKLSHCNSIWIPISWTYKLPLTTSQITTCFIRELMWYAVSIILSNGYEMYDWVVNYLCTHYHISLTLMMFIWDQETLRSWIDRCKSCRIQISFSLVWVRNIANTLKDDHLTSLKISSHMFEYSFSFNVGLSAYILVWLYHTDVSECIDNDWHFRGDHRACIAASRRGIIKWI